MQSGLAMPRWRGYTVIWVIVLVIELVEMYSAEAAWPQCCRRVVLRHVPIRGQPVLTQGMSRPTLRTYGSALAHAVAAHLLRGIGVASLMSTKRISCTDT